MSIILLWHSGKSNSSNIVHFWTQSVDFTHPNRLNLHVSKDGDCGFVANPAYISTFDAIIKGNTTFYRHQTATKKTEIFTSKGKLVAV